MSSLWKYKFHDTPDNQDCLMKTFYLGKHAFKWGVVFGYGSAVLTLEKRTPMQIFLRFPKFILPLVGMSTAFTFTMHVTTRAFPSWDHKLHYLLGGIAAAGVLGHVAKSGVVAFNSAVFLGAAAAFYQYMREERVNFKGHDHENLYRFDFPDDWKDIIREKRISSNWLTNDHDYRLFTKKERTTDVYYIDSN